MTLVRGALVTPNVQLARPLAQGSMGSLWVADHRTLETQVAVKFISDDHRDDPELLERFEREAKAAAQIKSHHVVQIFDYGVSDQGVPYMVLELLEGETLAERLAGSGTLSLVETATVVTHVARALAKAHSLGIVHRDIKPANVFLTSTDDVLFCKVFDFGVAKRVVEHGVGHKRAQLTLDGTLVGTPQFMSPEQLLDGNRVSTQADLWSLAVVAYHCLTGSLPFMGDSFDDLSVAVFSRRFRPASESFPGLGPDVDAFFDRAFRKIVKERFASAQEMAAAFRALADLEQEPASAAPSRPPSAPPLPETTLPFAARAGIETLSGATTKRLLRRGRRARIAAKHFLDAILSLRRSHGRSVAWLALAGLGLAAVAGILLFGGSGARDLAGGGEALDRAPTTSPALTPSIDVAPAIIEPSPSGPRTREAPASSLVPASSIAKEREGAKSARPAAAEPADEPSPEAPDTAVPEPSEPPPTSIAPAKSTRKRPLWGY